MKIVPLLFLLLAACNSETPTPAPDLGAQLPTHCAVIDPADKRFVACTGAFQSGGAAALCPAGYSTQAPALPAGLADSCAKLANKASFFAVDVQAWNDPLAPFNTMTCTSNAAWLPGLMGCGGSLNATANPSCQGWPVELICQKTSDWMCQTTGGLSAATNKDPRGGVVCFNPNP